MIPKQFTNKGFKTSQQKFRCAHNLWYLNDRRYANEALVAVPQRRKIRGIEWQASQQHTVADLPSISNGMEITLYVLNLFEKKNIYIYSYITYVRLDNSLRKIGTHLFNTVTGKAADGLTTQWVKGSAELTTREVSASYLGTPLLT